MLLLCIIHISFLFLIYCSIYLSIYHTYFKGQLWSWSYDSWIYNYLCSQCLSLLMLWVWIPLSRGILDTTLCDKVCQWLAACQWFSPDTGTPVSSTNKNWPTRYINWNIVESDVKTPLWLRTISYIIFKNGYKVYISDFQISNIFFTGSKFVCSAFQISNIFLQVPSLYAVPFKFQTFVLQVPSLYAVPFKFQTFFCRFQVCM